jgi:hypothetical protein
VPGDRHTAIGEGQELVELGVHAPPWSDVQDGGDDSAGPESAAQSLRRSNAILIAALRS